MLALASACLMGTLEDNRCINFHWLCFLFNIHFLHNQVSLQ